MKGPDNQFVAAKAEVNTEEYIKFYLENAICSGGIILVTCPKSLTVKELKLLLENKKFITYEGLPGINISHGEFQKGLGNEEKICDHLTSKLGEYGLLFADIAPGWSEGGFWKFTRDSNMTITESELMRLRLSATVPVTPSMGADVSAATTLAASAVGDTTWQDRISTSSETTSFSK